MLAQILRAIVALLAIPIAGVALIAHLSGDTDLRFTTLSLLSVVLAGAYALGIFRRKPAAKKSAPMPVQRNRPPATQSDTVPIAAKPSLDDADKARAPIKDDELYIVFSRLAGIKTGAAFRDHANEVIAKNGLAPLDAADMDRLAKEIDRRDLRGKTFKRTPGVALVRLQRADLDVEYGGTSWLGGLPTLIDQEWPRDDTGRAMHHLAQIDIGTIPDPLLPPGMPKTGGLAFFMNTATDGPNRGKVRYLPKIGSKVNLPPDDLVPYYDGSRWGHYVKGHARENAPDIFPRWPVEFILLPMEDQNSDQDAQELMADLLSHQDVRPLSPVNYRQSLPAFAQPWFWDTAHRFTMSIRLARDDFETTLQRARDRVATYGAEYQDALTALETLEGAFSLFVDEVSIWAVSHEPWDRMNADDIAMLERYFAQVRDTTGHKAPFKPFYHFTQGELVSVIEAATATLVAAANAPLEVFGQLPFEVRSDIDNAYRIAGVGRWHQMFGRGADFGTAIKDHTHHHLLLQLHSDQLVNWMWGDAGVVQFWITEEDLVAQNWDAVEVTVEAR